MSSTELIITIIVSILGFAIGFAFAPMPRNDMLNTTQKRVSSAVSIVFIAIFLGSMVMHWDIASWAMLIAALAGYLICSIPQVKEAMVVRFDFYQINPRRGNRR